MHRYLEKRFTNQNQLLKSLCIGSQRGIVIDTEYEHLYVKFLHSEKSKIL